MDEQRRNFFRNLGSKAAGIAAASVPVTLQEMNFQEEFKKLTDSMNGRFAEATAAFETRYEQVTNRLDAAALTQAYQQAQIHMLFLLVLISFVIDGGMSLTWLLTP